MTRNIGAKAIRVWLGAWGKARPQHVDVPLVVEIPPNSIKRGLGLSKDWSDSDWAAYRDAASKERRKLQETVLAMIFLSTFVVWGLEVALNVQPVFNDFRLDSVRLDLGISDTDATVIVVGLLTVVAALSIALAASRGGQGDQPPRELAAVAVWGNAAANASYLAAMMAMVTGLTQIFAPTKPALIIMLLGMGVIAAIVAAAVRSWIGRDLERRIEREKELEAVEVSLRALHASVEKEGKVAPVNPLRAYGVFLVSVGTVATVALVGLTLAVRALDGRPFVLPWALLPAGLALTVLITWPLIVTTISLWVAHTQPERLNRWQAHLARSVVVGVVILNWIAALYVSRSMVVDVTVTAAFLVAFVIPAFCLLLAREKPRGPAAFAFFRLIAIAERNRARILAEDERARP